MKHFSSCISLFITCLIFQGLSAQEPERFALKDFQLRGPVKSCVVKANYGEETFEFDREGRLTRSVTRFNDKDYDITLYKYTDGKLTERRDEVYREGRFDSQTSMAHIYKADSTRSAAVEVILSYDQSYQEQKESFFDSEGRLTRLVRTDYDGTDEILVEYSRYKGELTATYTRNGNIMKTIRSSEKKGAQGVLSVELVKEFEAGQPLKALETTRDAKGNKLKETHFEYVPEEKSFSPIEQITYTYDSEGLPESVTRKSLRKSDKDEIPISEEYIYQMDGNSIPNWVRKVTTPANSIVVRAITYYSEESGTSDESGNN